MRRRCCKCRGIRLRLLHQPLKKQRGAPRNAYGYDGGHLVARGVAVDDDATVGVAESRAVTVANQVEL
jgi:hypothetical protein